MVDKNSNVCLIICSILASLLILAITFLLIFNRIAISELLKRIWGRVDTKHQGDKRLSSALLIGNSVDHENRVDIDKVVDGKMSSDVISKSQEISNHVSYYERADHVPLDLELENIRCEYEKEKCKIEEDYQKKRLETDKIQIEIDKEFQDIRIDLINIGRREKMGSFSSSDSGGGES